MKPSFLTPVCTSRGSKVPPSFTTNSTERVPVAMTADSGTTVTLRAGSAISTSANISGFRVWSRLPTSTRTFAVRVIGSTTGVTNVTFPLNVRPGRYDIVIVAGVPTRANASSDS